MRQCPRITQQRLAVGWKMRQLVMNRFCLRCISALGGGSRAMRISIFIMRMWSSSNLSNSSCSFKVIIYFLCVIENMAVRQTRIYNRICILKEHGHNQIKYVHKGYDKPSYTSIGDVPAMHEYLEYIIYIGFIVRSVLIIP